jgi:hypothetical protein
MNYTRIADSLTAVYDKVDSTVIDVSQELTHFIVAPYFMNSKGGMIEISGGKGIGQLMMIEDGGESRYVDALDEDVVRIIDHLTKARVDWTRLTDSVAYTQDQLDENQGKELITNLIEPSKRAMKLRVIKSLENKFFAAPNANDDKTPWGLMYWVVKCTGATAGGYTNGTGYPTGFTTVAGLSLSKVPQYRNYNDNYAAVSKTDLILKMKRAHRRTDWVSPVKQAGFKGDTSDRRILLSNETVCEGFESLAEGQNENLGSDLASYHAGKIPGLTANKETGEVMFKRHPVIHAPKLDSDTTDPIYGLDMEYIKAAACKGSNMKMGQFVNLAQGKQHNVYMANFDHKHQYICFNRRPQWVISK